jgi:hypothetical protein
LKLRKDFMIRLGAIDGLGSFNDEEIAVQIRRLAKEDDFVVSLGGGRRFMVREAAEKWLAAKGRRP